MIRLLKLCVFPNDPIIAYYKKGEIKERYFNPKNFFDEVHIISFTDKEIEEEKVQKIVGNAKLIIHKVGKINIKNRKKELPRIKKLVQDISPDVIRTYNPLIEGWIGSHIAKELKIPFYVSLHTQYDHNRQLVKKKNLKKFLVLKYTEKFIEPDVLRNADKITMVFKIIEPYVQKHTKTIPELLYNRIDFEKFFNSKIIDSLPKPLVLSVGNLIEEKNHRILIKSMKNINANLLIIGNGPLYEELTKEVAMNNLKNKISIIKSIPYEEIPNYYKTADVFALPYDPNQEGLPMPVMEAMAAGTPTVIPESLDSKELGEAIQFAERNEESFCQKINQLLENEQLRRERIEKGLKKAQNFDITIIENREAQIYEELIKNESI